MTNAERALQAILDLCNKGSQVSFESDWGGNTLTVNVDGSHTHVGVPDGDFETLVEHLTNSLSGGPGLSFHPESPEHIIRDHTK